MDHISLNFFVTGSPAGLISIVQLKAYTKELITNDCPCCGTFPTYVSVLPVSRVPPVFRRCSAGVPPACPAMFRRVPPVFHPFSEHAWHFQRTCVALRFMSGPNKNLESTLRSATSQLQTEFAIVKKRPRRLPCFENSEKSLRKGVFAELLFFFWESVGSG